VRGARQAMSGETQICREKAQKSQKRKAKYQALTPRPPVVPGLVYFPFAAFAHLRGKSPVLRDCPSPG
jgi:hypothetical protein